MLKKILCFNAEGKCRAARVPGTQTGAGRQRNLQSICRQTSRHTGRHTDRQTDRQTNRKTDRQTDANRRRHIQRYTHTGIHIR